MRQFQSNFISMSENAPIDIEVILSPTSKINQVDFESITFGSTFSDHMLQCDFRNGSWEKPIIKPYEPFLIDPSAKVFHYGQAIFEGLKAYRDTHDKLWLFRPDQNYERFNKSAIRMAMPEVPREIFLDGLKELLKIDQQWAKGGVGNSLYIRPFMIAIGSGVIAAPSSQYRFMILLSPARSYYSGTVKVIVSEYYSRAANGGIGAAKAAANYGAQFYPTKLANEKGYQQIIWTDDATHGFMEESGTMNVFFRVNDTLLTAPATERILDGVTRKSIIQLATDNGMDIEVRPVAVAEIIAAAKTGELKEIFGAGTAAVINPIVGFGYRDDYYELPEQADSFALKLKSQIIDIQYKNAEDPYNWTVEVPLT